MTTFALEVKELPGQAPASPAATPRQSTPSLHADDAPAWSGDIYQEGDESTPEQSEWQFSGEDGEQAWLDRSGDGTITGWVRDPDGTVYRYTDPDAWAVDVDDAGMARQGGGELGGGEVAEGEDPNAVEDPTQGDDFTDGGDVDEDAAYDDYVSDEEDPEAEADPDADPDAAPEGDEPVEDETDEPAEGDEPVDEPAEDDAPDESGDEDPEDDEDENGPPFSKKKKGGLEAKVYHLPYR